jgi:hypothetical protein
MIAPYQASNNNKNNKQLAIEMEKYHSQIIPLCVRPWKVRGEWQKQTEEAKK